MALHSLTSGCGQDTIQAHEPAHGGSFLRGNKWLTDTSSGTLVSLFDKKGLLAIQPQFGIFESENLNMRDWDVLAIVQGLGVSASARSDGVHRPPPVTYWAAFKDEFRLLVCTEDEKYKKLRDAIEKSTDKSQTTLISMMAGTLGAYLGVAAALVIPLVVLCMLVVVKLGVGAFCRLQNLDGLQPFKVDT
jgi:hypothetical protein